MVKISGIVSLNKLIVTYNLKKHEHRSLVDLAIDEDLSNYFGASCRSFYTFLDFRRQF